MCNPFKKRPGAKSHYNGRLKAIKRQEGKVPVMWKIETRVPSNPAWKMDSTPGVLITYIQKRGRRRRERWRKMIMIEGLGSHKREREGEKGDFLASRAPLDLPPNQLRSSSSSLHRSRMTRWRSSGAREGPSGAGSSRFSNRKISTRP